jgi:hypothetical protein
VLQNLFLQGVEFSNPDLQAFETFFFRFELWQETGSMQQSWTLHLRDGHATIESKAALLASVSLPKFKLR